MSYHLIASLDGIPLSELTRASVQHEIQRLSICGLWPTYPALTESLRDLLQYQAAAEIPLILPLRLAKYARGKDFLIEENSTSLESTAVRCNKQANNEAFPVSFIAHLRFPTDLLEKGCELTSAKEKCWVIAPLCLMPTVKAILSIQRWDTYLSAHYLKQLTPVIQGLTPTLCQEIWQYKQLAVHVQRNHPLPPLAHEYLKLERKLDRQYEAH